jgi:hypothetical protein
MKRARDNDAIVLALAVVQDTSLLHTSAVMDVQHLIRRLVTHDDVASGLALALTCRYEYNQRCFRRRLTHDNKTHGVYHAARAGHVALVRWAMWHYKADDRHRQRACLQLVLMPAAAAGHMPLLEHYMLGPRFCDDNILETLQESAAGGGSVTVLQWLYNKSRKRPSSLHVILAAAATGGHLPVLQWLYTNNPTAWNSNHLHAALRHHHFHVADWLLTTMPTTMTLSTLAFTDAVRPWNLPALQWLVAHACPVPYDVYESTLRDTGGDAVLLSHLQWLRVALPDAPCQINALVYAASYNYLACLQWLHAEFPSRWSQEIIVAAMHQMAVVQWLLNAGCPGNPTELILAAIRAGRHALVMYFVNERHMDAAMTMREKQQCMITAADRGQWDTMMWLGDHGRDFTCGAGMWKVAKRARGPSLLAWLRAHQCPEDEDSEPGDIDSSSSSSSSCSDSDDEDNDEEEASMSASESMLISCVDE